MSDEEWLTPEQATDEIQAALGRHEVVTVNKVREWLRKGRLIGKLDDGRWRVYRLDPQDYLKAARGERSWRRKFYRGGRFSGR